MPTPGNRISGLSRFLPRVGGAVARLFSTLAIVAGITFICFGAIRMTAAAAGLFYMVAIVVIAASWGFVEAAAASVAAVLCFDYFFLPPVGTFTIASAAGWEAFMAFLAAALVTSHFSARFAPSARETEREREMEALYALSRAILLMDPARPVAKQIAYQIAQIFELPAVVLYDRVGGETLRAGPEDLTRIEDKLRESAVRGTLFHDDKEQVVVTAIRLGGEPIGSIALRGTALSDGALHALSNLVAIGLERIRGQESASRAEAARQSQELKSTLMDAITHEFKTPLTSIKAATTALLSSAGARTGDATSVTELIAIVDEEADRLERLVNDAIQMARVEGGGLQVARTPQSADSLLRGAVEQAYLMREDREIQVLAPPDLPVVSVDPDLINLAIRQIVDNALKYSPPGTPLTFRATVADGNVILSVADHGPGIAEADQGRIFEKFYRASSSRSYATGAGMGLAIARDILAAHGGEIRVESKPGQGAEFFIVLPVARQESAV